MDIRYPTNKYVEKISFHLLDAEAARRLSVKQISNPDAFDSLGHPTNGGLYDPMLGTIEKADRCAKCGLSCFQCPGHFGHIELAVPVYAPLTFAQMFTLLRQTCLYCHRFRSGPVRSRFCEAKLRLLASSMFTEARDLDDAVIGLVRTRILDDPTGNPTDAQILEGLKHYLSSIDVRGRAVSRSGAVISYRQTVIIDFLKRASGLSPCQYCKGTSPALYRHAGSKIFTLPLREALRTRMALEGRTLDHEVSSNDMELDESDSEDKVKDMAHKRYLTPTHVRSHLSKLWKNEPELLSLMFGAHSSNRVNFSTQNSGEAIFFIQALPVPPSRFRPPSLMNGQRFEHPQNIYLQQILRLNQQILELSSSGEKNVEKSLDQHVDEPIKPEDTKSEDVTSEIVETWVKLQEQVNFLFDSSKAPAPMGKVAPPGIKQVLERKEGLFRKHMMGKRVNFAARSVISPDPFIAVDEIGVPNVFATKLSFPEPVTPWNVHVLRQAVVNGPKIHPGALSVIIGSNGGSADVESPVIHLESLDEAGRRALSEQLLIGDNPNDAPTTSTGQSVVMRHLNDGDMVLMNRQPTLHKPSIMAHKVRVLPGEKTIRMHYANCNTYNADFDGDEMNMHLPQSQLARAEAREIATTHQQYLVPTDGGVLRGLIQDHVVSGVLLTLKDAFLDRGTLCQLLQSALCTISTEKMIKILPPAIHKPVIRWTGKQVFSILLANILPESIFKNLQLRTNGKISARFWGSDHAEEAVFTICAGEVMTGLACKAQFGASSYGISHAVYELAGGKVVSQLLTAVGRLLTAYDQHIGFTCRMDDLQLLSSANNKRLEIISKTRTLGYEVVCEYANLNSENLEHTKSVDISGLKDHISRRQVDEVMRKIQQSDELARGLDAAMKKATNVATSSIIDVCLPNGQFRPFPTNNMSLMTLSGAKGSTVNFSQIAGALGQQELEGRRVPVMASGKTLPAFGPRDPSARAGGYITQRFLTALRPQEFFFHCMAGREGLIDTAVKTSRSGYLQRCLVKHLESLCISYDGTVRDTADGSCLQFLYGEDGLDPCRHRYLYDFGFWHRNLLASSNRILGSIQDKQGSVTSVVDDEEPSTEAVKAAAKASKKPNKYPPTTANYSPHTHLGAVSEKYYQKLEEYINSNNMERDLANMLRKIMWKKFMRAQVDPGEAVGLLAAQGVGEPSTQMTLNTFHFAGFGAKNVTLGIPRLREIVMTASRRIKTPTISLPIVCSAGDHSEKTVERVAKGLSRLTLKQIVTEMKVEEIVLPRNAQRSRRTRQYTLTVDLLSPDECEEQFALDMDIISRAVRKSVPSLLTSVLVKQLKRLGATLSVISQGTVSQYESKSKIVGNSSSEDDGNARGDEDGEIAVKNPKKLADQEMDESDQEAINTIENPLNSSENVDVLNNNTAVMPSSNDVSTSNTQYVRDLSFSEDGSSFSLKILLPSSSPKLLLLDLVDSQVLNGVILRQVPGIGRVALQKDNDKLLLSAEGASIADLLTATSDEVERLSKLRLSNENGGNITDFSMTDMYPDHQHVYSNDIGAILDTYGVEAARAAIVKEIAAVFGVYGISIDPRHLLLIADYMTFDGGYRALNRTGMAQTPASPLLQMTFETTLSFLRTAALTGDTDSLTAPSARLVLGLPVNLGTGSLQVRCGNIA